MKHLKNFMVTESIGVNPRADVERLLPYLKKHIAFHEMFDYDPNLYQMCFEYENINLSDQSLAEGETQDKAEQKKILQYLAECDRDLLDRYYAYNQKISDDLGTLPNPWETELVMPFGVYFGSWFIREYMGLNTGNDYKVLSNSKLYSARILREQGFNALELDIFNWFKNGYSAGEKFNPKWFKVKEENKMKYLSAFRLFEEFTDDDLWVKQKVVEGFNLIRSSGFGVSYTTKNDRVTDSLVNNINEWILDKFPESHLYVRREKVYNRIQFFKKLK